jgi:hypothetical protein
MRDAVLDIAQAVAEATRALDEEPAYDHLPDFVRVDPSWVDTVPTCIECGQDVQWVDAVLMPCSTVEDGDIDTLGIVHGDGCPASAPSNHEAAS